ncbi:MAG: epoxyqueuosine reductase, partial [Lentisphaeria bacterium]|nr:epoxyqueuosine reductase [Lentisphaeria bacterium]
MNELTQRFLDFAKEKRADLVGIAPIERFADVPAEHHPCSIFPETKSVVVIGKRITRGTLRGLEEGTQFDIYGQYGLAWLKDRMLAMTTIGLATWFEDNRWEACPIQDLPTQVPPSGVKVKPDLPAPNVMIDVREAAVRAGLGEIGFNGEILTPQYGPRQRFQLILTDAPLDPTPMLEKPVCDMCMACVEICPLGALSGEKTVTVAGKDMTIANVNYGICRGCQNGVRPNPNHPSGNPDRLGALC